MPHLACYPYSLGYLVLGWEDNRILSIRCSAVPSPEHWPSPVADYAACQLQEYFRGQRKSFDFPLFPMGTPFQLAVWETLKTIPYGQTKSYGQIAAALGRPGAARAVGMACNRNPLWIAIPCHRVVGKNAALTGYAGGLGMKRKLLELEQSNA